MGWVLMSERELHRIEVLSRIDEGVLSVTSARHISSASLEWRGANASISLAQCQSRACSATTNLAGQDG